MELINEFVNNQFALYIPVGLVLVCVVLVFAFGFKSAEQPPFDKLSSIDSEERKTLGKKKKLKEKKTSANGNVVNVEKIDKSPSKESKKKEQESIKKTENKAKPVVDKKKSDPIRAVEERTKKSIKSKVLEKPVDFDDGNWETVPTKGDKKKKQDSPAKKEKKPKKTEKFPEMDKFVKEVLNKELQENEKMVESSDSLTKEPDLKEIEVAVEPVETKKEKAEKKTKKTDVGKAENIEKEEEKVEAIIPPKPEPAKVEPVSAKLEETSTKQPTANIAFDELGDVWTEAKQPKKSKKKSRREN